MIDRPNIADAAISVVIPAKNEGSNIHRCLEGVFSQSIHPIDCIVVDNNSTDNTAGIAASFNATVIEVEQANIGELRNIGARAASGTILAFLDADCRPDNNWLEKAVAALSDNNVAAVGNTVLPVTNHWVEKTWYFNIDSSPGPSRYIGSANLIVRRQVFELVGGFNPDLTTGEDRELCWRIQAKGYVTVQNKSLRVYHYGYPRSAKQFIKREFWHGHSIISDFHNLHKSRMFYVLLLNFILYAFLLVSIFMGNVFHFLMVALMILSVPLAIATKRCLRKHNFKPFLKLILLYSLYLTARTFAMIKCFIRCKSKSSLETT